MCLRVIDYFCHTISSTTSLSLPVSFRDHILLSLERPLICWAVIGFPCCQSDRLSLLVYDYVCLSMAAGIKAVTFLEPLLCWVSLTVIINHWVIRSRRRRKRGEDEEVEEEEEEMY